MCGLGEWGCPLHVFIEVYGIAVKGHTCGAGTKIYREVALGAAQRR